LVGPECGGDAAVLVIDDATAIVTTADVFTPVVDDPYGWGRIAAANALSDIRHGRASTRRGEFVGWPRDTLPLAVLREVLRGGQNVAHEAGCAVGGHSIDDPEPKYGMAVTGIAEPKRLMRNDAA
jgi:selenide, water dikinase